MNAADYCPRGRELKDEWMLWKKQYNDITFYEFDYRTWIAHRAFRQHVDKCDICKGVSER